MEIISTIEKTGIRVSFERLSSDIRGTTFNKNGKWYILINDRDRTERQNFTLAHEFFEIKLFDRKDLSADEKHILANELAADFLLPEIEFSPLVNLKNLYELKSEFSHASYEVIARRILKFKPSVMTVFDNGNLTLRIGSDCIRFPRSLTSIEHLAKQESYKKSSLARYHEPPLDVSAYFIPDDNSIKRVILVTAVDEIF